MCKISDKLKLCTCTTKNAEDAEHYWILYRHHRSDEVIMGIPLLPQEFEIGVEYDTYNSMLLEKLLNEGNCFDVDLTIKNRDILELNFSCKPSEETTGTVHLVYEFVYKKNKWVFNEYDPFDTNKLRKSMGKIVRPFAGNSEA